MSNVWNEISSKLWEKFIKFILGAVSEFVSYVLTKISTIPLQVFSLTAVQGLLTFFGQLGWALFITGVILAIFDICIEYQSMGRFNIKRQLLPLISGFFAVNLFNVLPVKIYAFAVDQQGALEKMIQILNSASLSPNNAAHNGMSNIKNLATPSSGLGEQLYVILLLIVFIYATVKVFMANMKRGGILLVMIGVGSLYMISIPRGYTDGFWSWCKQIIALCFTAVMQNILLYLGSLTVASGEILTGICIMLAANEVPRICGQFGLDTSSKANLGGALYTANAAMNTVRSATQIIQTATKA